MRSGKLLLAAGAALAWHGAALADPPSLYYHSAIYDDSRHQMLAFGGYASSQYSNVVWRLTLADTSRWDQVATTGPPSPRIGHSAIYDPVGDRMLVFGGFDGTNDLAELWALSLKDSTWQQLPTSGVGPPPCRYHTAIYDPRSGGRMIVYGGEDAQYQPIQGVWSLSLSSLQWTPDAVVPDPTNGLPPARLLHSAVYDPVRDQMVIFSGAGLALNDAWTLSLSPPETWALLQPAGNTPSKRFGHAAVYDPTGDRMILFGGNSFNQPLNDLWALSLASPPTWTALTAGGAPPSPRGNLAAVFESAPDRVVLFGGFPDITDPTWALSLGSPLEWNPFTPEVRALKADQGPLVDLTLPAVTVGDSVMATFSIANAGLQPLHTSAVTLPDPQLRLSPPVPTLHWHETAAETLYLAATTPRALQDSVVIATDDPLVPRRRVNLGLDVRGLDFDVRVLGQPAQVPLGVPFNVVVSPKPAVRIEGGSLHYRIANGSSDFDSLSLTPLGADFIATVPDTAVTELGVEYYVQALNSGFAALQPGGAPGVLFKQNVTPPASLTAVPLPTSGQDFLAGSPIEVEARLPEGARFRSGTIHFRRGGAPSFASDTLGVSGALGAPVGIIPDSVVGPRGVEYQLELTTATSTLRYPGPAPQFAVIPTKIQNLTEPLDPPASRYRLITLPLVLPRDFRGSLDNLLDDQYGTYDPVYWRAFSYDPDSLRNIEFSPAEAARFRPAPGRAFWLISRTTRRVDTFPIAGFSTPTAGDDSIPLAKGWNLFGSPFDFPVAWSDVGKDASAVGDPVAFDPTLGTIGDYAAAPAVLAPFVGYFIHADQATALSVPPRAAAPAPPPAPAGAAGAHAIHAVATDVGDAWRFRLRATTPAATDGSNEFGINAAAAEGFDRLDGYKPPAPPGAWVQVAFAHPEWGERAGLYRCDLRGTGAAGETWEIEVRSATPGEPVTLDLSPIAPAPPGLAMSLIDREQGSLVTRVQPALASAAVVGSGAATGLRYELVSFGDKPYHLAIAAGTEAYVAGAAQPTLAIPDRVRLDPSAPNPFRFATRVRFGLPRAERVSAEIFSVVGERVAVLLDRGPLGAGYHTLVWGGETSGGGPAPSGVYVLRLTAEGVALTKRLVLIR